MMFSGYKKPETDIGELRTPVEFMAEDHHGPEPVPTGDGQVVFSCFAETYNPSIKDREVLKQVDVSRGLTIKIRDPLQTYQPSHFHTVKVNDFRYEGVNWNIEDIRHDGDFITLVLGG